MKKIGFCFTGEGARGAIQSGIAKSLGDNGIIADFTAGISSGSICAAAYAHLGHSESTIIWSNIRNILSVFSINYFFLHKTGVLNQKPMEKIVRDILNKNKHPICESLVCRMNILDGRLEYISNIQNTIKEFEEAILGSVAISGLVQDRNGWVDAGSRQIAPIQKCIDAGCDEIYLILGRPLLLTIWNKPKGFLSPIFMGLRALEINLFEILYRDLEDWLGESSKYDRKKININIVEPTMLFYENTDFYRCKDGVQMGYNNYIIKDSETLHNSFMNYGKIL